MKKINFKKIFSFKNAAFLLFVFGTIFLAGHSALAGFSDAMGNVVGSVIAIFIRAISSVLILLVNVLMGVAAYSDFIKAPAVAKGWIVVRDVCNMFFVVILLIIAFATILGQEEYGAKKMLPKLVQAAVLINFSKFFCGLMIDLSSVVMLTFINAFSAVGAGNILDILGIAEVTQIAVSDSSGPVTFSTIVSAYIFGLIYVTIATVVIAAMLGMLVVRVVMIWILVVLSPLAFFLQAVPGKGAQYASNWWNKWTSNLLVGPIIAFFLWLSFAALQGGNPIAINESNDLASNNSDIEDASGLGSKAGTVASLSKFVIAIGMLLGGMKIAQEAGGEAGSAMGKVFNKGKGMSMAAAGAIGGLAAAGGKNLVNATGRGARNLALKGTGNFINRFSETDEIIGKKKGNNLGNSVLQWKDDLVNSRKKEKAANREKFLKKIGFGEGTAEKAQEVYNDVKNNSKVQSLNSFFKIKAGNKKYNKAKNDKEAYETSGNKSVDDTEILSLKAKILANPNYTKDQWNANEILASERTKTYDKNSKIVKNREDNPPFSATGKALKNMTEKKKKAKDRVGVMARKDDYFSNLGKGGIYRKDGISDDQKRWLDMLNNSSSTDADPDAYNALQKAINQVNGTAGVQQLDNNEANEMAMLLAAYKKGGNKMKSLTDLDNAVRNTVSGAGPKSTDSDALGGEVLVNYRDFDESKMTLSKGTGKLEYDAFAKNSAKKPANRNTAKDFIGASFDKINTRAKEKGVDFELAGSAPAANLGKEQVDKVSLVMSSLLDDEINALESTVKQSVANNPLIKRSQEKIDSLQQTLGGIKEPNSVSGLAQSNEIKRAISSEQKVIEKETAAIPDAQRLSELKMAKKRFDDKDLTGLSLNNTDVTSKGETDSDKRRADYNDIQHEQIHKAGGRNEELTHESADALQDAQLIGRIPGTNKRYDSEIGKMMGEMEAVKVDPSLIRQAIAEKIDSWKVSDVQRVMETEKGTRQTVTESVTESINEREETTNDKEGEVPSDNKDDGEKTEEAAVKPKLVDNEEHFVALNKNIENLNEAVNRLASSIGSKDDVSIGSTEVKTRMSIEDVNFLRRLNNILAKKIEKIPVTNPKPLTAMVISEVESEE